MCLKSRFKLNVFQFNLLLLSQIWMCQNLGFLKVAFQSHIYTYPFKLYLLCRNYQLTNLSRAQQHAFPCY